MGFGQSGSTSKRGACTAALLWAAAVRSRTLSAMPSTTRSPRRLAPTMTVRFRASFLIFSLAFDVPINDLIRLPRAARRPDHALVVLRHRTHPFVDELLQPF